MSDTPTVIKVRCPQCNKKLGFPTTSAGQKARCPGCQNTFRIELPPAPSDGPAASHRAAVPTPADSDIISVNCPSCAKKLRYPASAAGRYARCSGCNDKFLVEASADTPAPARAGVSDEPARSNRIEGDDDGLFNLLADAEASGEALAEQPERPADFPPAEIRPVTSSSESRRMTAKSGRSDDDGERGGSAMERLYGAMGSLALGCVLSAVGALIGAFVWYGIAAATGYAISYVAIGVGALAGLGMQLGVRKQSLVAGALAAVFGMAGILAGNLMYIGWYEWPKLQAEVKAEESDIKNQRAVVRAYETDEVIRSKYPNAKALSQDQYRSVSEEAKKRVAGMSDSQVRTRFEAIQMQDREADDDEGAPATIWLAFAALAFGIKGVLFHVVGLVAAFRVGYGGSSD